MLSLSPDDRLLLPGYQLLLNLQIPFQHQVFA